MKYLADTSALVRIWRRQVDASWRELARRGFVAICEPVLVETLLAADAKRRGDGETVARLVPELRQRRISAGPD